MRAVERVVALDVFRGCALLGIFIMNMPAFNASVFAGADGSQLFNDWWDRGVEKARTLLFDGKFNSMFSFLFALGFTIQLEQLRASDPAHALAGRMPLTNYLTQTALGLTIFYGWGIGLWGRFGPLEYLWRVATYGRLDAGK